MSDAYRCLVDHLPARGDGGSCGFATDVRGVRAWLDQLPLANSAAAMRQLLEAIESLNTCTLDGARRLEMMELLREPATQLLGWIDRQISGASFPLPRQKHELGETGLRFREAIALGYRIALAELCRPRGAVPLLRGKQVATAAVRALQHAADQLCAAYMLYRTPPVGAWRALHDVHRFIAEARLADRAIEDPLGEQACDARTIYAQALLLALANPYRHTQRGQAEVNALARALAPLAVLNRHTGRPHEVRMDPDADRGPGYIPEEQARDTHEALALQLGGVLEVVDRAIAATAPAASNAVVAVRGGFSLAVDAGVLQRVALDWGARISREHARLGGGYVLDSVLGLHDLHYMLAGGEHFDAFLQRVRGEVISLSESDQAPVWRNAGTNGAREMRLPVRVIDHGLGGYRLLWERGDGAVSARARVSEVVGLSLPDTGDSGFDWMVGVIRWIRIDDHGRVDAGVELLARRALPVGVRAAGTGASRTLVPGLLLRPAAGDGNDYTALLTATDLDRATTAVDLAVAADRNGPPLPAHATKWSGLRMIESTGIARHFARVPTEGAAPRAPA